MEVQQPDQRDTDDRNGRSKDQCVSEGAAKQLFAAPALKNLAFHDLHCEIQAACPQRLLRPVS